LPGSPAIDDGDPNFSPPPFNDQRGCHFDRVFNGRIGIGSFETQPPRRPCATPRPDPIPSAAHRRLPREEEADLALKNTKFAPGTRQTLIALFLLTIVAVPLIQLVGEFRAAGAISRLPMIPSSNRCHGFPILKI